MVHLSDSVNINYLFWWLASAEIPITVIHLLFCNIDHPEGTSSRWKRSLTIMLFVVDTTTAKSWIKIAYKCIQNAIGRPKRQFSANVWCTHFVVYESLRFDWSTERAFLSLFRAFKNDEVNDTPEMATNVTWFHNNRGRFMYNHAHLNISHIHHSQKF